MIIAQEDDHVAHTPDPVALHHIEQLELATQHLDQLCLDAIAIEGLFGRVMEGDEPPPSAP